MELRTLAYFALDPDASAMSFDHMASDSKAQARTSAAWSNETYFGTCPICLIETFEYTRQLFGANTNSSITNKEALS